MGHRLLCVLVDGVSINSVTPENMPYVSRLGPHKMETLPGFSVTCHSTILTGVYPTDHGLWFHWGRSPRTSPFRFMKWLPQSVFNLIPVIGKKVLLKCLAYFSGNQSVFGYPYLYRLQPRFWSWFDVMEKHIPSDPGAYGVPSVFERLGTAGVKVEFLGLVRRLKRMWSGVDLVRQQASERNLGEADFVYVLYGDIDHLSHFHGQPSEPVVARLREIDDSIRELHERMGKDTELLVFSDHGHVTVTDRVDIYRELPFRLEEFPHIVDDMFVRVWVRSEDERQAVVAGLEQVRGLTILGDDALRTFGLYFDDKRYGDIVAVLDNGVLFEYNTWGPRPSPYKSVHGYLPAGDDGKAFVASTLPLADVPSIKLVDIAPSILQLFGCPIPGEFPGRSIWHGKAVR